MTDIFLGEFLGTFVLILLGNGVVANVSFKKTIGTGGGIFFVTMGWAIAVFVAVMVANIWHTGGHLNPAVTIGQMVGNKITITKGLVYFASEFAGAMVGQIAVTIFYFQHIKDEKDFNVVRGMFSTNPTHKKSILNNLFSEYVGTIVLVVAAFFAISMGGGANTFGGAPYAIAMVVLVIGISLGGTTGWAINPARDLGPRIVFQVMIWISPRISPKFLGEKDGVASANWKYSWIPVIAPLAAGATVGAFFYTI